MPKKTNAFALKGFDGERILQRPFFKDFQFDSSKSDTEILETLSAADSDSVDDMEQKLNTIKAIHERLKDLCRLIDRQRVRLNRYSRRKAEKLGVKIAELRGIPAIDYLSSYLKIVDFMPALEKAYYNLEKNIQRKYRVEFAQRLKSARLSAGLTQRQLGDMVQISPTGFASYEQGKTDPSLLTLSRIVKILNLSSDKLLGLST